LGFKVQGLVFRVVLGLSSSITKGSSTLVITVLGLGFGCLELRISIEGCKDLILGVRALGFKILGLKGWGWELGRWELDLGLGFRDRGSMGHIELRFETYRFSRA